MKGRRSVLYADDDYESTGTLLRLRAPSLVVGLLLGVGIFLTTSSFEEVLARNVRVAFFLPFVVYLADALGTQTGAIYSRDLKTGRAGFGNYLRKELALGLVFGFSFGAFSGGVVFFWLKDYLLAATVAIASSLAIAVAPVVALLVTQVFQSFHKDPAVGSGPIATVVQDVISVLIYGTIARLIIL